MVNDSDSFFGGPSSEDSRPRAVNPQTGAEQSWQRASNYAAPLDNPHGLIKWKMRELIKGLSLRTDLARMLLTGAAIEDNAKADEIIADAHAAVAIDAKANEGTAVHAALSRSFLGHEIPAEYMPHVSAFVAELHRNGLAPVATEVRTLCVALGVIGHTDWIVRTQDGRYLILDVKTGKLGDAKRKFAVQCKAYAGSEYIDDGVGGWVAIPFAIDQTEAILAHVDPLTGATSLYRVDLVLGFYGATLAERVRDWHKIEVLSPYVPAHHAVPTAGIKHPEHVSLSAHVEAAIGQRVDPHQPGSERVTPQYAAEHPELYQPDGVPIPAVPESEERRMQAIETAQSSPIVPSIVNPAAVATGQALNESVEAEKAALLKLDKAALQAKAKNEHGATDLAHNRDWLACYIIAKRRGLDESASIMYAKSKGTTSLGGAASFSRPAPSDDQLRSIPEAGDLSFMFKAIEGAKSIGSIEALRSNLVERRGDHAWTDEMTEAARARVAELDAQNGVERSPGIRVLNQIGQATDPQHIAALWTETTLGGSVPDNWTEEMKSAADARMHQIMATQAPPPANPYGPQA